MSRLAVAYTAGLLAPLSPCGFAMLPAYLGYYLGRSDPDGARRSAADRVADGLRVGLAVSAGFTFVAVTAGLLLAAGVRWLLHLVPWTALAVGVTLTVLGVLTVAGRPPRLPSAGRRHQGGHPGPPRLVLFGAGYALAALSCSLAVLLAVVAHALTAASPAAMLGVLVAYAAGAATLLTGLALSAALASSGLTHAARRLLPAATRLGGLLLLTAGLYLTAYWLPLARGGTPSRGVSRVGERLAAGLTGFVDRHPGLVTAGTLALLLVAAAAARRPRRRPTADTRRAAGSTDIAPVGAERRPR